MKYESEIIAEILEKRGHKKSSLHYQSECVETWIEETKGAYPKLCDYESEWLNYINENPIGEFPYETIIDVTEATINNVVPYAYKSAILKGQTLVNLVSQYENSNGVLKATINGTFETNKKYIIRIYNNPFNVKSSQIVVKDATYQYTYFKENRVFINDMNRNFNQVYVELTKSDDTVPTVDEIAQIKVLVLEYQEGMENWDIPYFEGMKSVKMPVLTTSNEDGTKTNILTVNEDVTLRGIGDVKDTLYCLTGEVTERIGEIVLDGSHNIVIGSDNIESYETMEFFIEDVYKNGMINHKQISDKLPYDFSNDDYEHFYVTDERVIVFVKKSKLATQDTNGFKQYLSQNPLIVQYQLATESIKTIDLTITNQDGETLTKLTPFEGTMHISTNGTPIKPTVSMEIPVEAITQNLTSFIEEE